MRFGGEIRRRRKALHLTQDGLAERSRLSPHFISSIEGGRVKDPALSTVAALAKGLGVSVGDLVGVTTKAHDLSPMAVEIGGLFDAAPEDLQQAVATILRATSRKGGR